MVYIITIIITIIIIIIIVFDCYYVCGVCLLLLSCWFKHLHMIWFTFGAA